jgi:uncharacterized membrane protein YccC
MPSWSVGAFMRAVRATIVVCGGFAFADKVIGNLQVATFAAFGGFATLVMVSFAGTRREKLLAHAGLALAGSVLLTIGTAVNSSTALAAIVTVPVTFAVFFAGVAGPNAAAGVTGALLAYVLPAASPGTISMVPDRLAGWWLASAAGTAAVLLLSPRAGDDGLRAAASKLATVLADELDSALHGADVEDRLAAGMAAKHELLAEFTATPYRPTGLAARDQAFANLVELLEWCAVLIDDALRERSDLREVSHADRKLLEAASAGLLDTARLLTGGDARPDLGELERSRAESLARVAESRSEHAGSLAAEHLSFHAHTIAVAVLSISADAAVASRVADNQWLRTQQGLLSGESTAGWSAPRGIARITNAARRDASLRSVWLVNSVRGAIALAVAVAVADLSSVQHGFWVVLGTLSVLRANATSTGSTALRALIGTAVGFAIGGALLVAIGSTSNVLWAALPVAVFVAAYAPGTAPFAVAQAGFTVTIAVLFNLLEPVGWKVGVVRIEDVAIGCAVSVVVGGLFWPRGVSSVVGDDLADAFRTGASYLTQAVEWASGRGVVQPERPRVAFAAGVRLNDALRALIAEQGTKHVKKQELWRLVGGSMRLRLTAHAVASLPRDASGIGSVRDALQDRARTLAAWYERLAELVGKPPARTVPALGLPSFDDADTVAAPNSRYGLWLQEDLEHLVEHLGELLEPATHLAEIRRRPWWR